jgi:hypothetical protein
MNDAPSIGERYSVAIESATLKPTRKESSAGALDVVHAAGACGDTLGANLMRLRAEFDGLASEIRGIGNNGLTDRVLILIQLRSLREVREMLGRLSKKQAKVVRFGGSDDDLRKLTGRVLDVFLDPNCDKCEGRGMGGGGMAEDPGPVFICTHCKGSGKRRGALGRTAPERFFAAHLLALMERAADHAEQEMRRRLK